MASADTAPWGGHFHKENMPPSRTFWERELGQLSKPDRKGWAKPKAGCPFHPSKSKQSFSVNLETGAFHWFGCHARGGDIIDYIRKRDGSDFKTAAKQLGCWSDITWDGRTQVAQAWREAAQRRAAVAAKAEAKRRERIALRDELHAAYALYDELVARLSQLEQGAAPAYEGEEDHIFNLLPTALADVRLSDAMYCRAAGLELEHV
jgi:hypothetical protein